MAEILKAAIISKEPVTLKLSLAAVDTESPCQNTKSPERNEEELALIQEEARKMGYQSGFEQGLADGIAHANTQCSEAANQLHVLLENIHKTISEHRLKLTTEIADIVFYIAQNFFIEQQTNKEFLAQKVAKIISQINETQHIELLIHPQDLALLEHDQAVTQFTRLTVTADESLHLGGCILKNEHGVFDASIERQIDNLKQMLLQLKQGDPGGSLD